MMFANYLVRLEGHIKLKAALHVGSGDDDETYGALVMRDRRGEPVIPATTIAGLLRGLARQLALAGRYEDVEPCLACRPEDMCGQCVVCRLFGTAGLVSAWEFEDARWDSAQVAGSGAREVRDSVGIGRQSGAAAHDRLFSQEVVPRGAQFTFASCLHADSNDDVALMLHCLAYWRDWGGRVGKASGSGLGAFAFEYVAEVLDVHKPEDFEKYLYRKPLPTATVGAPTGRVSPREYQEQLLVAGARVRRADPEASPAHRHLTVASRLLTEAVRWHVRLIPVGPLQVKTDFGADDDCVVVTDHALCDAQGAPTQKRTSVDAAFLRTGSIDGTAMAEGHFIPGRSLKGVLRSHSERILRTCWALEQGEEPYCASGTTIVCDPNGSDVPRPAPCGKGCLCPACELWGSTAYGGRVTVSEAFPVNPGAFAGRLKALERVSIDRITGGAAEKRLFSARPLFPPREPDPALGLEFCLELECPEPAELGLMLFVLRDLCRERLRVGFGKRVGQGKVMAEILGCEVLTREGSPLHRATQTVDGQTQPIGPLTWTRWRLPEPVDLREWSLQFPALVDWAMQGWACCLQRWARPDRDKEAVTTHG